MEGIFLYKILILAGREMGNTIIIRPAFCITSDYSTVGYLKFVIRV